MHWLIFRPGPGGVLMTATGRWSRSTITSTPSWSLASTAWISRASSGSVMRTVAISSIIAFFLPRRLGRLLRGCLHPLALTWVRELRKRPRAAEEACPHEWGHDSLEGYSTVRCGATL